MKVQMKIGLSGTYNGEPYPAVGGTIELPDVVAERFIASGLAVKATGKDDIVDTTPIDEVEERPVAVDDVEKRPAATRKPKA